MKCNYWLQEEKYILKNKINVYLYHTRDTDRHHSVSIASQAHTDPIMLPNYA